MGMCIVSANGKRSPDPINKSVHSREEHDNNKYTHRSLWSDGLTEVM